MRYTVKAGDTLASIAEDHGLPHWSIIYDYPQNASFRALRPNPNVIHPGDELDIPEKEQKILDKGTESRHKFQMKIQKQWLRIAVEDYDLKRLSGKPYELTVGSEKYKGTTDGEGLLEEEIPAGASNGKLKVGEHVFDLQIGHLNPIDKKTPDKGVSGAQGRLRNLGYPVGAVDGLSGPKTEQALKFFQADEKLPQTGELDDATREKLRKVHGI